MVELKMLSNPNHLAQNPSICYSEHMFAEQNYYICIDLKSFYASVECVERGLDPMETNLIVADPSRTEKTICLAVTPAMKKLGVPNRCRVFQIPKHIVYITAPPRMQLYIDYSARIYGIYLKYFSSEDIHVYSVDEVFIDVTHYLSLYRMNAKELAITVLKDIKDETGLTATVGIGTNMYLAKIALDITAKHASDYIGILNEESFKKLLWDHRPITDFWMIGKGTAKRLAGIGVYTMGQLAQADENLLYRLFGINAELLMDHAWGIEPVTISDIKQYRTKSTSISSGQVLARDYNYNECRLIVKEMTELLCLDLVKAEKVTDNISLMLGFSYGSGQKPVNISKTLTVTTSSNRVLMEAVLELYLRLADKDAYYRRIGISFNNLKDKSMEQFDIFADREVLQKDRKVQEAVIEIKGKLGKNMLLKGMNLEKAGTTIERNRQIGGHQADLSEEQYAEKNKKTGK